MLLLLHRAMFGHGNAKPDDRREGVGLLVRRNLTAAWTSVNSSSCTLSVELWRISTHVAVVFGVTFQHTHTQSGRRCEHSTDTTDGKAIIWDGCIPRKFDPARPCGWESQTPCDCQDAWWAEPPLVPSPKKSPRRGMEHTRLRQKKNNSSPPMKLLPTLQQKKLRKTPLQKRLPPNSAATGKARRNRDTPRTEE